jgi:integrase
MLAARSICISSLSLAGRKGWLFRTARGHNGSSLSNKPMSQPDAWRMIRRRAAAAGIEAEIGCHTFRATGITAYLANGGALEHAQEMAAHESPRTTKLYDRTKERLTQDEVERIRFKQHRQAASNRYQSNQDCRMGDLVSEDPGDQQLEPAHRVADPAGKPQA